MNFYLIKTIKKQKTDFDVQHVVKKNTRTFVQSDENTLIKVILIDKIY